MVGMKLLTSSIKDLTTFIWKLLSTLFMIGLEDVSSIQETNNAKKYLNDSLSINWEEEKSIDHL